MDTVQSLDIGKMLRAYVKAKRIYQSAWARKVGLNAKTINNYLRQPNMRIDTLFDISQALNYNFLREIAALLPPEMPPHNISPQQTRIAELELQNNELQLQVKTLKEALSLVGGR